MRKILIMCAALMAMLVFTGCSDSPRKVAVKWGNAIMDGDLEKANKYSSDKMPLLNAMCIGMCKEDGKEKADFRKSVEDWKTGPEVINGDSAKVGSKDPITLKKIEGKWKVDVEKNN